MLDLSTSGLYTSDFVSLYLATELLSLLGGQYQHCEAGMTDHAASEPLPTNAPRTEASEQTPPMDAATQLASQQLIIALKCGKEVGWIVEQAVLALRELSDATRKLAESEDKRKVDIRFCHHCSVNGQAHLIRAAFPEDFK